MSDERQYQNTQNAAATQKIIPITGQHEPDAAPAAASIHTDYPLRQMILRADQIKCVKREIAMRERVYPRLVERGKMTFAQMEREIETMKAVLATLEEREQQLSLLQAMNDE